MNVSHARVKELNAILYRIEELSVSVVSSIDSVLAGSDTPVATENVACNPKDRAALLESRPSGVEGPASPASTSPMLAPPGRRVAWRCEPCPNLLPFRDQPLRLSTMPNHAVCASRREPAIREVQEERLVVQVKVRLPRCEESGTVMRI